MNETTQNIANNWVNPQAPHNAGFMPSWIIVLGILALVVLVAYLYRRNFAAMASSGLGVAQDANSPPPGPGENPASERDRVLRMLEAGKITAQESAELLSALSHATSGTIIRRETKYGAHVKMSFVGAALVLIGFFLPWFRFNLATEMQHAMSQLGGAGNGTFGGSAGGNAFPGGFPRNAIVSVAGGDIKSGLGWIVLLLGLAAAILPYLVSNLDSEMLRKIKLAALGIGGLILIYLAVEGIRGIFVGILAVAVGYGLEIYGTLKEPQTAAR